MEPSKAHDLFSALAKAVREERADGAEQPALTELERARVKRDVLSRFAKSPTVAAPRPSSRKTTFVVAASAALALAAAVLVWMRPATDDLGRYELEVHASAAEERSTSSKAAFIDTARDVRVEINLRPDHPVTIPVAAFAFVDRDAKFAVAPGELQVAPSGAVRFVSSTREFRGARALKIIVGAHLDDASARAAASGRSPRGARVYEVLVR